MNNVLRGVLVLPALLFLSIGLRWALDPAGAAAGLAMPLLDATGRGSQIGDIGGLFLSMGSMIALGVATLNPTWLRAPAMLLFSVAVYRVIATVAHGAEFGAAAVGVEVVVGSLLLFGASKASPTTA